MNGFFNLSPTAPPTSLLVNISQKTIDRFWSNVEIGPMDACWSWKKYCSEKGYGRVGFGAQTLATHRVVMWLKIGRPPAKDEPVTHLCGNRKCCNPSHVAFGRTPPAPITDAELANRFWSYVEIRGTDECWPWLKGVDKWGYGTFRMRKDMYISHRVAMMLHTGRYLESDVFVLHRCDNPPCCNPSHLFLGDQADNIHDMVTKGRGVNLCGEDSASSKLTEIDVRRIRRMLGCGLSYGDIGSFFGVCRSLIYQIKIGRVWKHLK